jgi:hypothetical protein
MPLCRAAVVLDTDCVLGSERSMMVGREAELELLRDAWRQASTRGPGIAVIRGEAGIGKSRLVDELGRMVVAEGGIVLAGGCAPYGLGYVVQFGYFRVSRALAPEPR